VPDASPVRGDGGNRPPPIPNVAPKIFSLIKTLTCKPKKYFSVNQRNCLSNLSYFSIWSRRLKHAARVAHVAHEDILCGPRCFLGTYYNLRCLVYFPVFESVRPSSEQVSF